MSRGATPERAIAMAGADPNADLEALLARRRRGLAAAPRGLPEQRRLRDPHRRGLGRGGVVVDAAFNHAERSRVAHVTMGADRLLPVLWESTERTLALARQHGQRVIAMEDVGRQGAVAGRPDRATIVLVVGNERDGIGAEVLARCDAVVAVPMAGFVPSYNLQAAISAIAARAPAPAGVAAADHRRRSASLDWNRSSTCAR